MSTAPITIIPTPEALDRAGLRLELAANAFHAHNAEPGTGDDEYDCAQFERFERPYEEARRAYRAMIELVTGESADVLERRLSA